MEPEGEGGLRLRKASVEPILTHKLSSSPSNFDGDEPLSPASRMFHEPDFNVHVIAIMGCKTEIFPDVVKSNVVHTFLKHPRFSSLQVKDTEDGARMKWRPTKVDLEKHIIVPNLTTLTITSPDQFIEDYVTNLTKTTLDHSKPLWELHLLNLKTTSANAVGVFKIHHSLGDGASLMSLVLACTRQVENQDALPTIPTKKKRVRVACGGWNYYKRVIWDVLNLLVMCWNTAVDVVVFMLTALFLRDTETVLKNKPGVEFTPRRFVWRTVGLDDMKLVKNAMNATINDVALGVTQAGLSRYLNRKYGEERKKDEGATEKKNNLPKKIRLRSTLLINLRPAGIQELADMMEDKNTEGKWGNWIGYVLLPFTIALRDDPLDYVREAKATVDRKKRSFEAIFTFSLAEFVLKIFGMKWAGTLSHKVISNTTMCFSNLVGPLEEIGFYGHPMAYLAPGSFGQPHGLMINFQSYVNQMTIVLSVDESTVPDPQQLCDDLEESLKLIKDAVVQGR